jgi:gluconate 2-dehydrogenase gamma chain
MSKFFVKGPAMSDRPHVYRYLTVPEIRFLDAAAARLIPADDLGPGAREADAAFYIDQQLASAWGTHGRNYRQGPWVEGEPEQGWQSRLTPQEIYRAAIRETDDHCTAKHGKRFDLLAVAEQDAVLKALEGGKIDLPSVSSKLFFDLLWRNVEEGFFADPLYGGNRDKIGWKLVGFPGVASGSYKDHVSKDEPYRAEPVSILDIQMGRANVDAQGYVKHIMLKKGN